jgi:hypothetical protein
MPLQNNQVSWHPSAGCSFAGFTHFKEAAALVAEMARAKCSIT